MTHDLGRQARDILDGVRYLALGTTDDDGRARVSPVFFVPRDHRDLYWVSYDDTHHSLNIARDARVSGVVFDSTVVPGPDTRAAYASAGRDRWATTSSTSTCRSRSRRSDAGAARSAARS